MDGGELFHPQFQISNLKKNLIGPCPPLWIPKSGKIKNGDFFLFFEFPTFLNRVAS